NCDGLNPRRIEGEPVKKGSGNPGGLCFDHVLGVGRKNRRSLLPGGGSHPREGAVFLLCRGKREDTARHAGAKPDLPHDTGDVTGSPDAFERRRHDRKTLKTLVRQHFPTTSDMWRRDGAVRRMAGPPLGITWIKMRALQRIN